MNDIFSNFGPFIYLLFIYLFFFFLRIRLLLQKSIWYSRPVIYLTNCSTSWWGQVLFFSEADWEKYCFWPKFKSCHNWIFTQITFCNEKSASQWMQNHLLFKMRHCERKSLKKWKISLILWEDKLCAKSFKQKKNVIEIGYRVPNSGK